MPVCDMLGLNPWRSLPVCLASYVIGAYIAGAERGDWAYRALLVFLGVVGFALSLLPFSMRVQLVCASIFGLVVTYERRSEGRPVDEAPLIMRARRILVRLSGLTMYVFMFQFAVIRWIVPLAQPFVDYTFDAFDYWGLVCITMLIILFVAALGQRVEWGIREFLG